MIITNIEVDGFRNINDLAFQPDPGVNVICGSNAQGKTNLLEAIWLASGEKSFRGARDREMVSLDLEDTSVRIDFKTSERMQNVSYSFSRNPKDKEVLVNGIKARTSVTFWEGFCWLYSRLTTLISQKAHLQSEEIFSTCACRR